MASRLREIDWLRLPESREAQAALAREYGVEAFCYYHYWFAGRQILERPFREVLQSPGLHQVLERVGGRQPPRTRPSLRVEYLTLLREELHSAG